MDNNSSAAEILKRYQNGERYFCDIDMENESFEGEMLEGIIFERCFLYSSFKGANLRNAKKLFQNTK